MYNHLSFGIASAPANVQQTTEKILQELPGVTCMDNIHITGCSDEEHLETLEKVLNTLWIVFEEGKEFPHATISGVHWLYLYHGLYVTPVKVEAISYQGSQTKECTRTQILA